MNLNEFIPKYIRQVINDPAGAAVVAERWNELWNLNIQQGDYNAETLNTLVADYLGYKSSSSTAIAEKFGKNEAYSKTEVDSLIDNRIVAIGAGDMARAVYDPDHDGKIDGAVYADNLSSANTISLGVDDKGVYVDYSISLTL